MRVNLHYTQPLQFKAPAADGEFAGMLAVFDTVDLGGDCIEKGAFADTLAAIRARGAPVPLLWSHDPKTVLGKFTELREESKGLFGRGRLTLETAAAREKYALLKDRAVSGLSIGYSLPDGGAQRRGDVRMLRKIELHEGSLVAVPMHPDARVTEVKALSDHRELERALREGRPIQFDPQSRRKAAALVAAWRATLSDPGDNEPDAEDLSDLFNRIATQR